MQDLSNKLRELSAVLDYDVNERLSEVIKAKWNSFYKEPFVYGDPKIIEAIKMDLEIFDGLFPWVVELQTNLGDLCETGISEDANSDELTLAGIHVTVKEFDFGGNVRDYMRGRSLWRAEDPEVSYYPFEEVKHFVKESDNQCILLWQHTANKKLRAMFVNAEDFRNDIPYDSDELSYFKMCPGFKYLGVSSFDSLLTYQNTVPQVREFCGMLIDNTEIQVPVEEEKEEKETLSDRFLRQMKEEAIEYFDACADSVAEAKPVISIMDGWSARIPNSIDFRVNGSCNGLAWGSIGNLPVYFRELKGCTPILRYVKDYLYNLDGEHPFNNLWDGSREFDQIAEESVLLFSVGDDLRAIIVHSIAYSQAGYDRLLTDLMPKDLSDDRLTTFRGVYKLGDAFTSTNAYAFLLTCMLYVPFADHQRTIPIMWYTPSNDGKFPVSKMRSEKIIMKPEPSGKLIITSDWDKEKFYGYYTEVFDALGDCSVKDTPEFFYCVMNTTIPGYMQVPFTINRTHVPLDGKEPIVKVNTYVALWLLLNQLNNVNCSDLWSVIAGAPDYDSNEEDIDTVVIQWKSNIMPEVRGKESTGFTGVDFKNLAVQTKENNITTKTRFSLLSVVQNVVEGTVNRADNKITSVHEDFSSSMDSFLNGLMEGAESWNS